MKCKSSTVRAPRVQDIKDHYEQKWKRCEKLYEELHKALLEVDKKRCDLSKYGNVHCHVDLICWMSLSNDYCCVAVS